MHAHLIIGAHAEHQKIWCGAFGDGLQRHGWRITFGYQPEHCDMLVLWGVRHSDWITLQRRAGGEVCILERGYLGDRTAWTSVSFGGGLNGRGVFRGPFQDNRRWQRYFAHLMQPWRDKLDGVALIMGQVPGDMAIKEMPHDWYTQAHRAYLGAVFRPHPLAEPSIPLADDLARAALAVTWSSNSAVDAVLAGVPTVSMDAGSMAWDVTGHELGDMPPMPDRTAWAHRLSWCQWTADEMRSGDCWAAVEGEKCDLAS